MKKLTHEEAVQKLLEKGIEVKMVEEFVGRKVKMKFECVCGKIFESTYASVFQGAQCGCKKEDFIGKKFGYVTVLEKTDERRYDRPLYKCVCDCGKEFLSGIAMITSGDRISCGCKKRVDITGLRSGRLLVVKCTNNKDNRGNYLWECKCDCGNTSYVAATYLTTKKTQSCGCVREEKSHLPKRSKDYSGQTFDYLYVKEKLDEKIPHGDYLYLCQCKCGKEVKTIATSLLSGDIKSCGCRPRKNILGERFGRLKVTKLITKRNKSGKRIWKCLCDCGRTTYVEISRLIGEHTSSCGNCNMYIKGVRVSKPQLLLHKLLGRGVINFKTKCGLVPDIAFVHNGMKIAVEYDEKFWHDEEKDLEKTKRLLKDGWKIIRFLVDNKSPDDGMIEQVDEFLNTKCSYARITL